MHQFKDINGAEWQFDINVDSRNQVKAAVPTVDFFEPQCIALLSNKETLGRVLYVLCRDQIESRGKSDRDFFKGLKGDAWDGVMNALHEELCDFFQNGERQVVKLALEKTRKLRATALAKVTQMLEGTSLDDKLARTLKGLSGESPASSASIPAPTPSAT